MNLKPFKTLAFSMMLFVFSAQHSIIAGSSKDIGATIAKTLKRCYIVD
ncbi:hypothetical protein [Chryseobacterium echinoideorum]|nr:hypothetical protein [Chryseobacterium echinoideorum]